MMLSPALVPSPSSFADLFRGLRNFRHARHVGGPRRRDQGGPAITQWTFRRYNTGRVVLPEAISVMTLL